MYDYCLRQICIYTVFLAASAIPDTVDLRLLTPKLSTKFSSDKNWTEFVGYHHVIARRDNGIVHICIFY
jgi:hypothetical protein